MTGKNKPYLIMVYGAPGAGRTFFAEQFSEKFRAPFLNFDALRTSIFKKPEFSPEENKQMFVLAEEILSSVLRSGIMTIVEGNLSTKADRKKIAKIADKNGYQPLLVWIQTDINTTKTRAKAQITASKFDDIIQTLETPTAIESPIVISGKHTFGTQLKVILRQLSAQRANQDKD